MVRQAHHDIFLLLTPTGIQKKQKLPSPPQYVIASPAGLRGEAIPPPTVIPAPLCHSEPRACRGAKNLSPNLKPRLKRRGLFNIFLNISGYP